MIRIVSKKTVAQAIADLSINIAAGYLGVLLISPGFLGVERQKYLELLISNLPPAIIIFVIGLTFAEKGSKL